MWHLFIAVEPFQTGISLRKYALVSDGRNFKGIRDLSNRLMELGSKGMGCIHHQTDIVLTTEVLHSFSIQRTIDALPMMKGQVLLSRLRTIIVR